MTDASNSDDPHGERPAERIPYPMSESIVDTYQIVKQQHKVLTDVETFEGTRKGARERARKLALKNKDGNYGIRINEYNYWTGSWGCIDWGFWRTKYFDPPRIQHPVRKRGEAMSFTFKTPHGTLKHEVRVLMHGGMPWFHARDILKASGKNVEKGITKYLTELTDAERMMVTAKEAPKTFLGQGSHCSAISLRGVQRLLRKDTKRKAQRLLEWIGEHVVPAIAARKKGNRNILPLADTE